MNTIIIDDQLAKTELANSVLPKWNVSDEYQSLTPEQHTILYAQIADQSAICCLNLSGDMNIGTMLRTASIMGIGEFHIVGRRKYDRRSSVGTQHHIPLERVYAMKGVHNDELDVPALQQHLTELRQRYKLVFVEQVPHAYPYTEISERKADGRLPANTMFIMGNEACGIPPELHHFPDADYCMIPQYGIGRSLTVSVACGIVIAEWRRNG